MPKLIRKATGIHSNSSRREKRSPRMLPTRPRRMMAQIRVPLVQRTLPAPTTILLTVGRTQGACLLRIYRARAE